MFRYFTLDDFVLKGKLVGVRVDFNSPLINGKITLNDRIKSHLETIKELQSKGARVVVLAHQGRKGGKDFTSLRLHYELIKNKVKNLKFIPEVYSEKVLKEMSKLKEGEILILENLRTLDDELHPESKNNKIKKLIETFDYYVLDAFSVAHRNQSSIVFSNKIPVLAGKVMEKELRGLGFINDLTKKPFIYLFGGAKPDDLILLVEKGLKENKVNYVLTGGVIGEIFLYLKGYYLGKKLDFLKEKGFLNIEDKAKELLKKYKDKIITPLDVAIFDGKKRVEIKVSDMKKGNVLLERYLTEDIGKRTVLFYKNYLKHVNTIYFKGPPGNFEEKPFEYGTRKLLTILENLDSFRFLGGGHSLTALNMYADAKKFSYVSLAGGALVHFLLGEKLPGILNLEKSYSKFEKEVYDFLVTGSNVIDYRINTGYSFKDVNLGDKLKIKDNFELSLGGGGTNVSVALSRLGGKVTYLGKLSEENKDFVTKELGKNKVSIIPTKFSKIPISKSIVLDYLEDKVIFSYRGQNENLKWEDFNVKDIKTKFAYFSSLSGKSFETLIKLAIALKKQDVKIAFNPSLYLIESEKVMNLVKLVNILILNYEEAKLLSGGKDLEDVVKILKKQVEVLVITDGHHGAYGIDSNNELVFQKADKVKVVDSTGAGDCFAATFIFFYLKGYGLKKSMELASKNAANVVRTKGAKEGLLYYDDLINLGN